MRQLHFPVVRVALIAIALGVIAVLVGHGADNTAEATTFTPQNSVSVDDPTPGAHSDLNISFSLAAPDAFPNITNAPAIQFLPGQWGINTEAPIGTVAGSFDTFSTLAVLGITACTGTIPVSFTMHVASTDINDTTSQFDLEGSPVGTGYSGQFAPDPDHPDGISAGITHYPTFLNQVFPSAGAPIMRLWGGTNVLLSAVSLNILTYAPGQLPGFPPSLGYPTVVVVLNPIGPLDLAAVSLTNDLCTPLSLVNTNFGISQDNPDTAADEGGIPLLTNPKAEKDHVFTLVTESQPDADNDGVENMLDTCPFDPNVEEFGRSIDSDGDHLDAACDPFPTEPGNNSPDFGSLVPDEDGDNYTNRADNCTLVQNGIAVPSGFLEIVNLGPFLFPTGDFGAVIGPDNQVDSDGDGIGDACDPNPSTVDGHVHQVSLERAVTIERHGVKLDDLSGPNSVSSGGSAVYTVAVENKESDSAQDIPVALRVVEDCATVNGVASQNSTTLSVNADGTDQANFSVDWSGCPDGEYTVQADACHAGDPAPAGFFGSGACPGSDPHGTTDSNPLDDAPRSISVTVGSP